MFLLPFFEPILHLSTLSNFLGIKRKRDGFGWISGHSNAAQLVDAWSELLKYEKTTEEHEALVDCCDGLCNASAALAAIEHDADPRFCNWVILHFLAQQSELSSTLLDTALKYTALPEFFERLREAAGKHAFADRALTGWLLVSKKHWLAGFGERQSEWQSSESVDLGPDYWAQILSHLLNDNERRLVVACYATCQTEAGKIASVLRPDDEALLGELIAKWPDVPAVYALAALDQTENDVAPRLERFLKSTDVTARAHAWRLCRDRQRMLSEGLKDADWNCRVAVMESLAPDATAAERQQLVELACDASAFVRRAIAQCIGKRQWSEWISALIGLLRDHREFGEGHDQSDYWTFSVARAACSALKNLCPLPESAIAAIQDFLGGCRASSVDKTVHGLLFRILAQQPSETSLKFCSQYFAKTWLSSKWSENQGHDLLVQCLHTVVTMLLAKPEWSAHLNIQAIADVAGWDDGESWIVGPALVVLGLIENAWPGQVAELAKHGTFSTSRARLLLSISPTLQKNRPEVVMRYIPGQDPYLALLDWATVKGRQPSFEELGKLNPNVTKVLDAQQEEDELAIYERWTIKRLIAGPVGSTGCDGLPHPFAFDKK